MDKRILDSKGNQIQNKKMVECEKTIIKNGYEIIELNRQNQNFEINNYGVNPVIFHFLEKMGFDAKVEAAELDQKIRENDHKIREFENVNDALKKCMVLNSRNFNVSCEACKERPRNQQQVIVYPRDK
jgi:hypothetical protein